MNMSVDYEDTNTSFTAAIAEFLVTLSAKLFLHEYQTVGTSEAALNLGNVTPLGYILIANRDDTNFVEIRTGTGAAKFVKLKAGQAALFPFGSGVTAPYAIADTNPCKVEYWLFST